MRTPVSFRLHRFPLPDTNGITSGVSATGQIWLHPRIFFRFSQTKYQLRKTAGCAIPKSAFVRSREVTTVSGIRIRIRRSVSACTAQQSPHGATVDPEGTERPRWNGQRSPFGAVSIPSRPRSDGQIRRADDCSQAGSSWLEWGVTPSLHFIRATRA